MKSLEELAKLIKEELTKEINEYADANSQFLTVTVAGASSYNLDINQDQLQIELDLERLTNETLSSNAEYDYDSANASDEEFFDTAEEIASEIIEAGVEISENWNYEALADHLGVKVSTLKNNINNHGRAWATIRNHFLGLDYGDLDGAVKGMQIAEKRHETDYDDRWDAVNAGELDEQDLMEHRAELNTKIAEELAL